MSTSLTIANHKHKVQTTEFIESLSVDSVIFGFENKQLKVLLIKRNQDKGTDLWALPGGFVKVNEAVDDAARRVLSERTGIEVYTKQFHTFGDVHRFPGKRIVTIAYYAFVLPQMHKLFLEEEAEHIFWGDVYDLPALLYDHKTIITKALESLRNQIKVEPIGFNLLPKAFPLLLLQQLYESINNTEYDKPNFRRKILRMKLLIELDQKQDKVAHRSARLYSFNKERYNELLKKGYNFEW